MLTAEERYQSDPEFHSLVDLIYQFIEKTQFTPSELREAVMLAAIRYEMTRTYPSMCCPKHP